MLAFCRSPFDQGVGSVGLAIPNLPGLVGLSIYSQAVLVPAVSQPRLSNVVPDTLAR